jgi:acyl carrier protein
VARQFIGRERIHEELKKAVSSALGVDADKVKPDSVLTLDLGAESLDFLDISYHLEQAFGIRMARYFVLDHAEDLFGEGKAVDENSCLTPQAVEILKLRFQGGRVALRPGMDMEEVVHLVTVDSMAGTVLDILNTLPDVCPHCSGSAWNTEDGTHIACEGCGGAAVYKTGDELIIQWLKQIQDQHHLF